MNHREHAYCLGLVGLLAWFVVSAADSALPPIRSGCEVDYPPFSIVHEDGRADGFSVELLRAALAKMGREVSFRTGPWAEVRGWLERGEVDCLPLVGRTPEREALFDFTVPYLTMHGAIVVRDETTEVRTLADLRGRRVGVMKGDNAEEFLRRQDRDFEILAMPTFTEAFRALAEGRCDAVVAQRLVAIRLLEESGLDSLTIVDRPIPDFAQAWCFAVKEGDRKTLALLNEGLALVVADGTLRRLHAKWFAHLQLPSNRPIIIGGDHNYPPFEFLDEHGRPTGYNVDLVRAAAEAAGLDVRIRLGPWAEMMAALERGEIDAMQGMFYAPERDATFDFSQAHLVNHCVAVVRRGAEPPPTTVAELAGKRLVVQDGDIMHGFCREHGLTDQLTVVEAQEDALRAVAAGDQDCALVARMTAFYWIEREGWDNLVVGRTPLASPEYCFAVPNGNQALLAQLSEGLAAISHSGEYRRIHEQWLGVYRDRSAWRDALKYVAVVAGPLLVFALLMLLWSWSLRREVANRTAELRETAARLARSEALLKATQSISKVGGWEWDIPRQRIFWTDETYRIHGLEPGAIEPGSPEHVERSAACYAAADRARVLAAFRACIEHGTPYEIVCPFTDFQGRELWVRTSAQPVIEGDQVVRVVGDLQDITEHKRQEARIEHLNRVLRAIRGVNHLITHESDRDALLHQTCDILISTRGYRSAWIALQNEDGTLHVAAEAGTGEDFALLREQLAAGARPHCCERALQEAPNVAVIGNTSENCAACPLARQQADRAALAGALRHEEHSYGVLLVALPEDMAEDPEEQAIFRELIADVAYALHAMEVHAARAEQHALLEAIYRNAPLIMMVVDRERRVRQVNAFASRFANRSAEQMLGLRGGEALRCMHALDDPRGCGFGPFCEGCAIRNTVLDTLENGTTNLQVEADYYPDPADGQTSAMKVLVSAAPLLFKGQQMALVTILDVTEHRQAVAALAASETRYRRLLEAAQDGMLILDARTGQIMDANPFIQDILGYSKAELIGKELWQVGTFRDIVENKKRFDELVQYGYIRYEDLPMKKKNGDEVVLEFVSNAYEAGGEQVLQCNIRDITVRKLAEEELHRSSNLLEKIFEVIPVGLWLTDREGTLLRGNPAGVRIWGAEPKVPISEYGVFKAWRLPERTPVTPDDWALARTIREGVTISDELLEIEAFDGNRKTILNYTAPILADDGTMEGAIVINLDVSDRLALEDQLRQAQKMESVGRLAGGVAHDFNNMLTIILGHAQLLTARLADDDPNRHGVAEIEKAAQRSANLTRQLLAFARKETIAPVPMNLNDAVGNLLSMLRRLIGEDLDLNWRPGANPWRVKMDPGQIDQILANLCVNARDAIGGVGKVTIETGNADIDEAYCRSHAEASPGQYVMLAVSDDGSGMDRETLARVFEPFFTTKPTGAGTGLGLATVYGIVKQNEGFVNVYSELGEGTVFRIYLPRLVEATALPDRRELATASPPGSETILLVEDEGPVREIARVFLEDLGYRVFEADCPAVALELAAANPEPIHLLLTDVVMPGMSGRDLAERLRAERPAMKVLYMSGYTANSIAHRGVLDKGVQFIGKPFTQEELARKVRDVLDA